MKIFDFDPAHYRGHYAEHGWAHIPRGIAPEFLDVLRNFIKGSLDTNYVEGAAIGGSKDQAIFEFPDESDYPAELFDAIAATCDLRRETMTLSERHIKAYFDDTPVEQTPHKDRYASQVSVGLSIDIPEDSELLLYPQDEVSENPFNISGALPASLPDSQAPATLAERATEVVVDDQPGDVIVFRGSAIWHCRRRAAGAINLYLKINDFNSDPLGEDPFTASRRQATLEALAGEPELSALTPVLARRFDFVSRAYLRQDWAEVPQAHVFDRTPVLLDDLDVELIRRVDGERDAEAILAKLDLDRSDARRRLERLARAEVLDLLDSAAA